MTVTTWQAEEAPAQSEIPASSGPSIRVDEGTIKSSITGQEQTTVHRNNPADITPIPGDIFSTARNSFGSPTGDRSPSTTTIELEPGNPGSRVTIQVAESLGFITKNEYGQYIQVTQPQGTPEGNTEQPEGPQAFDQKTEESFSRALADVPSQLIDQVVAKAAVSIASDGEPEDFAASISSTTGIPLEQLQAAQGTFIAAFQEQADATVKKLGADPEEFYEWAKANHSESLARAIREHVATRSPAAYRELVNSYLDKVPPRLDAIATRYQVKPASGRGTSDMVTIDGVQMEVTTAARLRLI
jgi:hypothetical protein